MVRKELNAIISGKDFDAYVSKLSSEMSTAKIDCSHEYSLEDENPFLTINVSIPNVMVI